DVLAISLSGHDGIGHRHGPNSREMEEITVAEDRALAKFFTGLQKSGLLDKSLIVLTADHGASPAPSWVETKKIPTGKISESDLSKKMADALDQKFGKPKNKSWFSASMSLNFYFDYETLKSKKLELASAEALAKEVL